MQREGSLAPYIVRFVIANVVLTIVAGVIAEILKLKSGTGLAIGATMASSFFASAAFAKDQGRAPTAEEKSAFAWRALLATWLISLVFLGLIAAAFLPAADLKAFAGALKSGMVLVFGLGTLVVVSAIYYVGIRWSFGWYARTAVERGR